MNIPELLADIAFLVFLVSMMFLYILVA